MTLSEQNIRGVKRKRSSDKESEVLEVRGYPRRLPYTNIQQGDREANLRRKLARLSRHFWNNQWANTVHSQAPCSQGSS